MVKNPPANVGDTGSIPGSGRSPGERNGNPFQYSCLGNPKDRGAWWETVHGVAKCRTQLKLLSTQNCNHLKNQLIQSFIPSGPLYEAVSLQMV